MAEENAAAATKSSKNEMHEIDVKIAEEKQKIEALDFLLLQVKSIPEKRLQSAKIKKMN